VRAREPASVAQQQASKLPAVHDTPARATAPVEPARLPAPALAPAAPAPDPAGLDDDYVRTLAELPEAVRRELPKVVFGGYMYSPNPADRLILVDKILRSEGDEVAPGLKLEKLLPKSAVLKYKGYRYRVLL
jgi:general secretion pathway protein B